MEFIPKRLDDGSLQINVTLSSDDLTRMGKGSSTSMQPMSWGKTDYCVTCKGDLKYTIETYGDIAANIEAAATCMKETGDPSYGLSKGSC